jgi:predicted  nucleic acid-binding Zn-ribbon protein
MSVTETLRECHRLRVHIRTLQAEIDRGPRLLAGREETLAEEKAEHAAHHTGITKLKLKQREDEVTLKETETRLAKLEAQLTGISVQKEYAAKESEIAQAKAKKGGLEDAILNTIGAIEEKTAQVPAVEKKWAEAQADFAQFKQEAAERLERLKTEQENSRVALAKAEGELPEDVKKKYDTMVKVHGPEAMAAVKNKTCQGCRTSLAEQRMLDLQRGALVLCPNCGKMLYPAAE